MTEQEFLKKMKEDVLDTEKNISLDMFLKDIEDWESLSFVSFLAMAKEGGFNQVDRNAVNAAKTVGDLFELVK